MSKKTNLSLKEIRVQSFVTALDDAEKEKINGAILPESWRVTYCTPDDNCYSYPWLCCTAPEPRTCS